MEAIIIAKKIRDHVGAMEREAKKLGVSLSSLTGVSSNRHTIKMHNILEQTRLPTEIV
jgi:hypothetical protein